MFGYKPQDYDFKIELAKCFKGIGAVYLAQYLPTGQYVAVKRYRMEKANKQESSIILAEILTMRQFNHRNVHSYHTAFVENTEINLVQPLMPFGSCKDTIGNYFNSGFPEMFVALIIRDVLCGLEYIHRHGYIHRSIRGSHILLHHTKAVLSGFRECSCCVTHGRRTRTLHNLPLFSEHSLNWLAPEVLEQNLLGYTEKSDIYSIGITCCELANGVEPFTELQPTFMLTEKLRGNVPTLLDCSTCPDHDELIGNDVTVTKVMHAQRIYSQRSFSDEFHQFTELCMRKCPSDRPSAIQLLSHSFLKQCRNSSILDQLQRFGLRTSDYSKLRDENLSICQTMDELNVNTNLEWNWEF